MSKEQRTQSEVCMGRRAEREEGGILWSERHMMTNGPVEQENEHDTFVFFGALKNATNRLTGTSWISSVEFKRTFRWLSKWMMYFPPEILHMETKEDVFTINVFMDDDHHLRSKLYLLCPLHFFPCLSYCNELLNGHFQIVTLASSQTHNWIKGPTYCVFKSLNGLSPNILETHWLKSPVGASDHSESVSWFQTNKVKWLLVIIRTLLLLKVTSLRRHLKYIYIYIFDIMWRTIAQISIEVSMLTH